MADERVKDLVERRVALETGLQNEKEVLSEAKTRAYEGHYAALERALAARFRATHDEEERITIVLELMRILENRLVYLHNFSVDPTSDSRVLARLVTKFIVSVYRPR